MGKRILIVDDEEAIVRLIAYNLEKEGFLTVTANDGSTALDLALNESLDLVILDIMLPTIDGLEVCRRLRQSNTHLPILMLTAKDTEIDKILGLELGADDYVTKPFSPRELVARIKAILRRSEKNDTIDKETQEIVIKDLAINFDCHEVRIRNNLILLTLKEFELLSFFVKNPGRVLTRNILLDQVWDYSFSLDTRIVDVHISRLREKIEIDPKNPEYIETVRGIGYKLKTKN